jgi:hypothetical protein
MLLWADSFDHYGTTPNGGRDAMLAGAWAGFSAGNGTLPVVSNARGRTGSNSLLISYNSLANAGVQARRVLGGNKSVMGVGFGVWMSSLPGINGRHGIEFRSNANAAVCGLFIQSDGAIGFYTGASAVLIGSSEPVLQTGSWSHVEAKIVSHETSGSVEVRVNGITVLAFEDLNLGSGIAAVVFGNPQAGSGGGSFNWHIDDIVTWDDQGDYNNDFIGPARVATLFPAADTAQADWIPVGETDGYACINNVPPDGDTTYISAEDAGDISEFELSTLPPETEVIAGVYIPVMGRLEDAGVGQIQVSLVSNSEVSEGPDIPLTTAFTYWGAVHEVDPDTDLPWTKEGIEAALVRIEKTL